MLRQLLSSCDNGQSMVIDPWVLSMLRQLSSIHDNGQSMVIHPLGMKHEPSVVFVSWQQSEHCNISLKYEAYMGIYPSCIKHALTLVIVSRQRSEHGKIYIKYETCSVSCHRQTTTVRAWFYIPLVWTMLRQLLSSHDNGQSMVVYP